MTTSAQKQAAVPVNGFTLKGDAIRDLDERVELLESAIDSPTTVALTNAVAKALVTKPLAAGAMASGYFDFGVKVSDGIDHQSVKGRVQWSAVNKAGTITIVFQAPTMILAQSNVAKTIAVDFSSTSTAVDWTAKVTVNSSLVPTTENFLYASQDY